MRRIIVSAVIVVVLIVAGLFAATLLVDQATRRTVEERSTEALGVQTRLDRASVGLFTGGFKLTGYNLANPEGFDAPHLLHMIDGEGRVRLGTLFADVIELPYVTLRNIDMHLERLDHRGNYDIVLASLGAAEQGPDEEGRRYVIRELVLRDVRVHVTVPELGERGRLTVPIRELRLRDVGTEMDQGVAMGEIAGALVKAILAAVMDEAGEQLPGLIQRELAGHLRALDPIAARAMDIAGEALRDPERLLRDFDPRRLLPPRE